MNKYCLVLFVCLLSTPIRAADSLRPAVPDPASVQAFEHFWQTFEDYESHSSSLKEGKNLGAWDQIKNEWGYVDQTERDKQLELLKEAAERYEDHLDDFADASNAPYVKLNLAQILNKIGRLQDEKSEKSGQASKRQALALLGELNQSHPSFAQMEETQYLRASILESLDQKESALPIWTQLSQQSRSTIYGVHAAIAVGDQAFAKERAADALKAYKRAQELLRQAQVKDKDFELLRVQYRIVWAAYRAAELETCIAVSQELLEPGRTFRQLSVKRRVEQDASDLMGDALFELDNLPETKAVLQRTMIRSYAGTIGLRIVSRLRSMPTKDRLIDLGQFLVERYPQAREMPEILLLLADAYKEERRQDDYLATLERLSLMLSPSSLWRNQHQSHPEAIKSMQEKALAATQLLASTYYEQGMTQGTSTSFKTAVSYYDSLLQYDAQNAEAENWRLRRAHSLYFSGQLVLADRAYDEFKQRKVSPQNLELAFYHQTLTREKMWRESLQKSLSGRGDAQKDPIVIERLRGLEKTVDAYADRFPNRPHTNDLLLLAASANRDVNNFGQAEGYWNRTLLSEPSPAQRTLAIRGLIQARIRTGTPQNVLEITQNFLKLENWDELGAEFRGELLGVVSIAAKDASEDLNKKGQVAAAGQLLLNVTEEFPKLIDRETLYRDGAYYMAIAGQWDQSYKASELYLKQAGPKSREADMIYLKARSLEYKMKFTLAAQTHLQLAQKYPDFSKSKESSRRAEELALAEEDFSTAGRAALASLAFEKSEQRQQQILARASAHFTQAKSWNEAGEALNRSQKLARSYGTKLEVKLLLARLHGSKGDENESLALHRDIVNEGNKKQDDLEIDNFRQIMGEASFELAEKERRDFESMDISESQDLPAAVQAKALRLERCLQAYNKVINIKDPDWASRARYAAGQATEGMAQSIKTALAKSRQAMANNEENRLREQANRWQGLAQEYFSQNILAKHREPHRFKDSIWMARSAMKVSGYKEKDSPSEGASQLEIPASMGPSQPYQWSH